MKKLSNYQRVSGYLVKMFKAVNEEYFNNELEVPTITVQSTIGAYGHISTQRVWHNNEIATYELNLSADYLNRPIEEIVTTLIHEASHLWALQHGIKDTSSRNNMYHNRRFKKIAEEIGRIKISHHEKYGWTISEPSEETLDFIIRRGFQDIELFRCSYINLAGIAGVGSGSGTMLPPVQKKKHSSTRKYICPCCGNSFRATKNINVLCMDCDEQYLLAE